MADFFQGLLGSLRIEYFEGWFLQKEAT